MVIETKSHSSDDKLRKINNALTLLVVGIGVYLIIAPFWPQITYFFKDKTGQTSNNISYESDDQDTNIELPDENRLVLPQISLDDEIFEGRYSSTLNNGIWHRPQTSTPDKGGNTVMVGHRFTYSSPAIFYHLDKLNVDDQIAVIWNKELYTYKVREVKIVEPTAIEIENNTQDPILTLYTCTPMWTAKQRLVVVADLIRESIT